MLLLSLQPPKLDIYEFDKKFSIKCLKNFKPQPKDIIWNALRLNSVGKRAAWLTVLTQDTKILTQNLGKCWLLKYPFLQNLL